MSISKSEFAALYPLSVDVDESGNRSTVSQAVKTEVVSQDCTDEVDGRID